jgi:hypothetical protein
MTELKGSGMLGGTAGRELFIIAGGQATDLAIYPKILSGDELLGCGSVKIAGVTIVIIGC